MTWEESLYPAIHHAAFERYVLDLARGIAAEEERGHLENRGKELRPQIKEIQLKGEYPETKLAVRTYDQRNEFEGETAWKIWGNDEFFPEGHDGRADASRIAGDILMWARGG